MKSGSLLTGLRALGHSLQRLPRRWGVLLVAAWCVVIWSLSAMSGGHSAPQFPRAWLMNSAHAPLYGFLALLALISFPRRAAWPAFSLAPVALTLISILLYGLLDEWHQSFVPGRDSSLLDVMTDMLGASVTLWIAAYLGRERATGRGIWLRIAFGLILCLLSGLCGT